MNRLLLLRHAKSSWDDPGLADDARPLAGRGRKAAPRVGRELCARGWTPQRVLISPAARTRQTWDLMAAELTRAPVVTFAEALYMGTAERLLGEVQQSPEQVDTLLLIGHNPGLEELAKRISSPDSDPLALARLSKKFSTAALACFVFDEPWADLRFNRARLTELLRPKDLD
jgi:phosphohistidine phosphatase